MREKKKIKFSAQKRNFYKKKKKKRIQTEKIEVKKIDPAVIEHIMDKEDKN